MTAQPTSSTPQFVADLLSGVQVTSVGHNHLTATTGQKSDGGRRVVEGSRVLAQAITADRAAVQGQIRPLGACRIRAGPAGRSPDRSRIDVVSEGRTTATAVVMVSQSGKRCVTVTILSDVPTADVIRHESTRPDVLAPPGPIRWACHRWATTCASLTCST